ncbi:DUF2489 domain-containing protein [Ferrimonas marina]|uniref:DUF2489 domain-containing protein n=1 Tax=Ferrimonas marina TaxID=299255 RepID=A0A1M5XQF4_9GAMM|nr:DUF2489 domain-containing protein [Ferrimonas marina]SHI01764.1 Protein of unknown function [Ferrimonas marina]
MSLQGGILILAVLVIIALAAYAAHLMRQVALQSRRQQQEAEQRRQDLKEQIQLIAKACLQQQCEPAEGALRLVNLLRGLPGTTPEQWREQFPGLHALYDKVADQPILSARKALKRNERMKLDLELEHWQAELGSGMDPDLTVISSPEWPAR